MAKNDGGPAFPQRTENEYGVGFFDPGMSLRDWFAGQALAGDLAATPNCRPSVIGSAERAYAYADAMIDARNGG